MMDIYIVISGFVFGAIIGSFLNVVALRFNTGKSLGGRSECFSCGHTLHTKDLFPLVSFLVQRGRCRYCSSSISVDNIFAEIITALIFMLITMRALFFGIDWFSYEYLFSTLFLFIVFSILVVILLYDMKHKIIPDELSLSFGILSFIGMFFFSFDQKIFNFIGFHIPHAVDIFAGLLIPLPFVLLWILSRGKWLGLGDPKLMVGIGFLLGIQRGISAIFLSFWIGTLFVVSTLFFQKITKKTLLSGDKQSIMKKELPFGPFLVTGALVTLIIGLNLFAL